MKRVGRGWMMLGVVFGALVVATAVFASGMADRRCAEFMGDLRDGGFDAATAHFDHTVKAALTSQQLGTLWQGLTAANGKILPRDRAG